MHLTTEGIVLRLTRMANGRGMVSLFTKKYGKLSCGYRGQSKKNAAGAASVRPFSYGEFQIFEGRNYHNIDRADITRTFYGIGEDIDRYARSSFILELTEKVLSEGVPQPEIFSLLITFLEEIEKRKSHFLTLVLAYEIKLLGITGVMPEIASCSVCGKDEGLKYFSIPDGGMICRDCGEKAARIRETDGRSEGRGARLIYCPDFDIIKIIQVFAENPLQRFRGIGLSERIESGLQDMIREYTDYYLDTGRLKSESFFAGDS